MVDDLQNSEESAFVTEEIERIISDVRMKLAPCSINRMDNLCQSILLNFMKSTSKAIEAQLKDQVHDERKVQGWIDRICETCISDLTHLCKPFKYVVTCAIMQRNGAGLHTSTSCYWDTVTDGVVTVKWPGDKQKDQNNTMYCVVTVFGLGF